MTTTQWFSDLRPSHHAFWFGSILYAVALYAVWHLDMAFAWKGVAWLILVFCWARFELCAFCYPKIFSTQRLSFQDGTWEWIGFKGKNEVGELSNSVIFPWFVMLYLKKEKHLSSVIVWGDSVDREAFRKLKVILGWIDRVEP